MSVEAELADGTVLEFPDGTSREVVQRTVKSRMAGAAIGAGSPIPAGVTPPALPDGRPATSGSGTNADPFVMPETVVRAQAKEPTKTKDVALNAASKGIADIPDALLNTPTNVLNLGKAAYGTAATAAGHPDLAPAVTPTPDYVRKFLEKVGAIRDITPETTVQKAIDVLVRSGTAGTMSPASSFRNLLRNFGLGATAGGAAEATEKVTGKPEAGVIAGLLAPAGVAKAAPLAGKAADFAREMTSPDYRAGKKLYDSLTDKERSRERMNDPDLVPGSEQTLAQRTRDPGAAALELWARQQPQGKGEFEKRGSEQAAARDAELRRVAPGEQGADAVQRRAQSIMERITGAVRARTSRAQATAVRAREDAELAKRDIEAWEQNGTAVGAPAKTEVAGTIVREAIEREVAALKGAREAATAPLREQAYAEAASPDVSPILQQVDSWLKVEQSPTQRQLLAKVAQMVRPETQEVTRELTSEQVRDALRRGTDPRSLSAQTETTEVPKTLEQLDSARRAINTLKTGQGGDAAERLSDHYLTQLTGRGGLLDAQMTAASPTYGKYLEKYRELSRPLDPYAPDTLSGKVLARDQFGGRYLTPDAEVMGRYFRAGNQGVSGSQEFLTAIRGNPEAMQAMRGYVADQILTRGGGVLDAVQLRTFMRQNDNALRTLGIRDDIDTVAKAGQFVQEAAEQRAVQARLAERAAKDTETRGIDTIERAEKTALGRFLKQDADRAVANMMNTSDREQKLRQLVRFTRGDPEAQAGLRAALKDFIFDRRTAGYDYLEQPRESFAKQMSAWQTYRPILERTGAFERSHLSAIDRVFEDIDRAHYALSAGKTPGMSPTHQFKSMADYIYRRAVGHAATIVGGTAGGMHGGLAEGLLVGGAIEAYANGIATMTTERIIQAALDPKFARVLIDKYNPERAARTAPALADISVSVANGLASQQKRDGEEK